MLERIELNSRIPFDVLATVFSCISGSLLFTSKLPTAIEWE